MGLILSTILFVILAISTNHWIHTIRMRAGFWQLCHLEPIICFYSVIRSPAALSLTGLVLITIGLISTIIFYIFEWHLPSSVRFFSLISVLSLSFGTFFLVMSYVAFSRIAAQFCYSFYLMIVGHVLSMTAAIITSYIEGRRNALVSTSVTISRLAVRRP